MGCYPKIEFDLKNVKYKRIYENPELSSYRAEGVNTTESKRSLGLLMFPDVLSDRTFTMAAFVTSIDGKIAYPDNPFGPLVASENRLDPIGASLDFWILNFFRASMDAIFIGAGTMQKEPDLIACIYDELLEKKRISLGMNPAPIGIICSLDGLDIPYDHEIFNKQSVIINTSPDGMKNIAESIDIPYFIIGPYKVGEPINDAKIKSEYLKQSDKSIAIIVTGEGDKTDSEILLKILKIIGINRAIVESPSFTHSLMKDGLLDELIQSYSTVYIGGKAINLGSSMESFTSTNHPHMKVLSIDSHLPGFLYFRHKIIYDLNN